MMRAIRRWTHEGASEQRGGLRQGGAAKVALWTMLLLVSAPVFLSSEVASAQGLCTEANEINKELQYLRRLSIDLRGQMPEVSDYEEVIEEGRVSEAMILEMMEGEPFRHQIRKYHRDLLTADLSSQRFTARFLRSFTGQNLWTVNNSGIRQRLRGFRNSAIGQGVCANQEVTLDNPVVREHVGEDGKTYPLDGWVRVKPWWDRTTSIKVCAFDALEDRTIHPRQAQAYLYYKDGTVSAENAYGGMGAANREVDCTINDSPLEGFRRGCGCGPGLAWCSSDVGERGFREAVVEQMFEFIDQIVREERPYRQLLTSRTMPINGPLLHWKDHLSFKGGTLLLSDRDHGQIVPEHLDLATDDWDTWANVELDERHAGLLTSYFYLLKWQTNRGRANAFYNMFMCKSFAPPTEGLPASDDPSVNEINLTHRKGCDTCHRALEPMASYWGHWAEGGYLPLGDAENEVNLLYKTLPPVYEKCRERREGCEEREAWRCIPNGYDRTLCRFFYQVDALQGAEGDGYSGYLASYLFADVDPLAASNERTCDVTQPGCGYTDNMRLGPVDFANKIIESGEFAQCSVRRLWGHFLGRDMTLAERGEVMPVLSDDFIESDYQLKQLILKLVQRPEYREATWAGLSEE